MLLLYTFVFVLLRPHNSRLYSMCVYNYVIWYYMASIGIPYIYIYYDWLILIMSLYMTNILILLWRRCKRQHFSADPALISSSALGSDIQQTEGDRAGAVAHLQGFLDTSAQLRLIQWLTPVIWLGLKMWGPDPYPWFIHISKGYNPYRSIPIPQVHTLDP
jgi:hypothetical protein